MNVRGIVEQAYHRNGIGGNGFVVTLFKAMDEPGVFVAISFQTRWDFETREQAIEDFATNTAVLSVAETAKGNVAFAGGNSWRGSDRYGREIAEAWAAKNLADDSSYDPFLEFVPESSENPGWQPVSQVRPE
jgi:hypothetical protein